VLFDAVASAYGVVSGLPFALSLDAAGGVRWVGRYGVAEAAPGARTTYGELLDGTVLSDGTLVGVGSRSEAGPLVAIEPGYVQRISATGAPL
jgi:hypothetical protein